MPPRAETESRASGGRYHVRLHYIADARQRISPRGSHLLWHFLPRPPRDIEMRASRRLTGFSMRAWPQMLFTFILACARLDGRAFRWRLPASPVTSHWSPCITYILSPLPSLRSHITLFIIAEPDDSPRLRRRFGALCFREHDGDENILRDYSITLSRN